MRNISRAVASETKRLGVRIYTSNHGATMQISPRGTWALVAALKADDWERFLFRPLPRVGECKLTFVKASASP